MSGRRSVCAVVVAFLVTLAGCVVSTDGFESGNLGAWTATPTMRVEDTVARTGRFAAEADTTGAPAWAMKQLDRASNVAVLKVGVRVARVDTHRDVALLGLRSNANAAMVTLYVTPGREFGVRDDVTAVTYTGGVTLTTDRWYTLELKATQSGATSSTEVRVDDVLVGAMSRQNIDLGTKPFGYAQLGDRASGAGWHAYFDDVTLAYSAEGPIVQPSFPIRAAFYYPWFPESWTQNGVYPFTNYHPSLGYYSSRDLATVQSHVRSMKYGGMNAAIASWWWPGHWTDTAIPTLLQAARNEGGDFRWALYYELEGNAVTDQGGPNPTATRIQSDLTYIWNRYAQDPTYLRIGGRPVLFVYADALDGCDNMARRWIAARDAAPGDFYLVLKVFAGYASCAAQPDEWHQYSPAVATDSQGSHSFVISPGFWLKGAAPRLTRDVDRWRQNVEQLRASNARFELVTTFDEWGEGTSVESATEWASPSGQGVYLDVLHDVLASP